MLGLSAKQSAAQVESTSTTHEGAQDASAQGDWRFGHCGYNHALCSRRHSQIGEPGFEARADFEGRWVEFCGDTITLF